MTRPSRPWTPARVEVVDGVRTTATVTVKRHCDSCNLPVGDATAEELTAAAAGLPLPDVRDECPRCAPDVPAGAGRCCGCGHLAARAICPTCWARLPPGLRAVAAGTYREGSIAGHAIAVDRARGWLVDHPLAPATFERTTAHAQYEPELGIPRILARLQDRIFEGLPKDDAMAWPGRFLAAIAPGADLSGVWPRFAVDLLTDPGHGVIRHTTPGTWQHAAIVVVSSLYLQQIGGREIPQGEWSAAAADADAFAAAADAYDAAAAAAAAAYRWQADLLVHLLTEAPTVSEVPCSTT